jgi:hypothetical protein
LTQRPPQETSGAAHEAVAHTPDTQLMPPVQAWSQRPQWSELFEVFVHAPPQRTSPTRHPGTTSASGTSIKTNPSAATTSVTAASVAASGPATASGSEASGIATSVDDPSGAIESGGGASGGMTSGGDAASDIVASGGGATVTSVTSALASRGALASGAVDERSVQPGEHAVPSVARRSEA